MTTRKDLKRLVRARMARTGESYTAARAQIIRKSASSTTTAAAPAPANVAGIADEKVRSKTGRTWEEWTRVLDAHGASGMTHREIARLIRDRYEVSDWWTQTVTVGYERIKGRRAIGQRADGTYEASKSRTFGVPVGRLFDAWATPASRRKWLADEPLTMRTSNRPKSLRFAHADGSVVVVGFTAKGRAKSSVAVQHGRLASRADAAVRKSTWARHLDALREALE